MSLPLSAGTYTVLLTDGEYIPAAFFETGGQLGDGFFDLTGGAFQTCNGADCVTDTANWALDVTTPSSVAAIPEPVVLPVSVIAFLTLAAAQGRRRRQISALQKGEQQ
jgi:hypothetical protein